MIASTTSYVPLALSPAFRYWKQHTGINPPRQSWARGFSVCVAQEIYCKVYSVERTVSTEPTIAAMCKSFEKAEQAAHAWAGDNGVDIRHLSICEFIYCRATYDTLAEQSWRWGNRALGWYVDVTTVRKLTE